MRFLFALTALMSISIHAYALCPNLAAKYNCTDNSGTAAPLSITQSENSGVTSYVVGDLMLIADGYNHGLSSDALKNGMYTATCEQNDQLTVQVSGEFYWGSTDEGSLTATAAVTMSGSNVNISAPYVLTPQQGGNKTGTLTMACTPAP